MPRPRFLERRAGDGESSLEPIDVAGHDCLPRVLEPGPRRFDWDVEALRLRDHLIERLDLVHGALHDLFALRLEEPFLEVALQAVDFLQVVGLRGFLRVGPEFLEIPSRDSQGKTVFDERAERLHDGGEVIPTGDVDLVRDPLRVSVDVGELPRIDEHLGPSEELRGHADVRAELRVGLQLRPEFRQAVANPPRILLAPRVPEDVFDDLLVFDRLDVPLVLDRLAGVEEDHFGAAGIGPGGSRLFHHALDRLHQVRRRQLEPLRQGQGHFLRLGDRRRDLLEAAGLERGVRLGEGLLRPEDGDVRSREVRDRLSDRGDPGARGLLRLPSRFLRLFREDLEGLAHLLFGGPGMLDGVRVLRPFEMGLGRVQERDGLVDPEAFLPGVLDPALRAGDEILGGGDELLQEFLCRRVEVREDRVDVVELPFLHRLLRRAEAFLRSRDVDVRLPKALDELLDRNELRRRRAGLFERDPLFLQLPGPSPLGEDLVDLADGIEDRPGATRPKVRLRLREVRGELTDVDALVVRVRDRRARSPQGVLGLSIQRDPHAFDEPLGRREEMFRLFQGAASDRLFGRREDVGRSGKVDVLGEQVRDLSAHGLHASMDSVRPLHPHPGVLGIGLSLGLEARARELLDLRDARLSRVDRVPVPGLGIGRLSVREHLLRRLEPDPVGPPTSDLAAGLPEGLCRGAPERFPCRGDVVLDAVEERVGLHQPAVLDRHRGVGEFPFEADRVVLTRLPQGDDVVPRLEDPDVQAFLRLRVLVRHPPVDQGLHVDRLAEVDRLVDFSEELASDLGIQSPRGVRQDDLQRILHDGPEMRVPHAFRRMPRRGDQTPSRADILALDGGSQLDERLLEPGDVGAEVLQVVPIHLEAGERVPDGLDEGRLADGIMGVVGEALDLTEILRRHRDLGLVQDDLRPSHVGPLPFLPARLPSDLPEGRLCGRDPSRLAQAVPRLLGEEGDVSEDAAADRVAGLGEELAGLPDVDPFVPSEVHLGRGAVEEPLQPGPSRLRVCGLHRLRGERPDLSVLPDREGLAGLLEEGLGIADGPSPFLRVPDAGLGLFQTRVEGVLPAFVEAPERHPLQEAFRRRMVPARREGPCLFDVPPECLGVDAGRRGLGDDRVRPGQGLRHARLPPDDAGRPSGPAGQIEGASEVSRGHLLLRTLQQTLGEGDIGRVLARRGDVLFGRRDGPLHLAGACLDRRRLIERLPARIAVRPAVRDVRFAERAAGHGSHRRDALRHGGRRLLRMSGQRV